MPANIELDLDRIVAARLYPIGEVAEKAYSAINDHREALTKIDYGTEEEKEQAHMRFVESLSVPIHHDIFGSMTFDDALVLLRKGRKVRRTSWAEEEELHVSTIYGTPYIFIGYKEGVSPIMWTPAVTDLLAHDWRLIE